MDRLQLTSDNYYSKEANMAYVSVSQYKDFVGTIGRQGCEHAALAKVKGELETPITTPLLVGSYVDAYFEGTLPQFSASHPEIYSSRGKTAGELKSEFKQASVMIDRAEKEPLFMKYMEGDKQLIMIGEIEGVPIKCKYDSVDGNRITDLKTVKSIGDNFYIKDYGYRVSFVENWGYDIQAAVYREIYRQNTGDLLPFYICAISKDKTDTVAHPRVAVIEIPESMMNERLEEFKRNITRIQDIKTGVAEPIHCGHCDYCADTLPLSRVISVDELIGDFY